MRAVLFKHDGANADPPPGGLTRRWYTGAVRTLEGDLSQLARVRNSAFSSTVSEHEHSLRESSPPCSPSRTSPA